MSSWSTVRIRRAHKPTKRPVSILTPHSPASPGCVHFGVGAPLQSDVLSCCATCMRHWSIILAASAIMVLGFVASLLIFGDQDRLKQLLIGQVELQTGRQMSIDGAVSLRLFPRFRIEADQIQLFGPVEFQGPELVTSDRLVAEVRLLPLIRGRLETRELTFSGARLNVAMDAEGLHSLGGLMRRPGREGAPGMIARGPLRLEDVEIEIGGLFLTGPRQIQVDQIELDGLLFDRSLNLRFQGALGRPALISDVTVDGVLFVPAETGQFRLADLRFTGRHAGAGRPFELLGGLSFTAIPPLAMQLDHGRLRVDGQELSLQGRYEQRKRPFFLVSAAAETLDLQSFAAILAPGSAANWSSWLVNAVAEHDFELDLELERSTIGDWRLPSLRMTMSAADGIAQMNMTSATLPGALLEVEGSVETSGSEASIMGLAKLEVDDLAAFLSSMGSDLVAGGVGAVRVMPIADDLSDALAEAEFEFFDGRIPALEELRRLAGLNVHDRFDHVRGHLQILPDAIVVPMLLLRDEHRELQVQAVWLRRSGLLQGTVTLLDSGAMQRFQLGGSGNRPQFTPIADIADDQ